VADDLTIVGADKFGKLAKALREYGDKDLRRDLYAGINRAVKPLTADVKARTPMFLPNSYAVELAKSLRVKVRRRGGRDPGVKLRAVAKTKGGRERNLTALNRGRLRHPLYGNRSHWFNQPVRAGWWDQPLLEGSDEVRRQIVSVIDDIGNKLDRKM